jgi:hypothetical protein
VVDCDRSVARASLLPTPALVSYSCETTLPMSGRSRTRTVLTARSTLVCAGDSLGVIELPLTQVRLRSTPSIRTVPVLRVLMLSVPVLVDAKVVTEMSCMFEVLVALRLICLRSVPFQ